MLLTLTIGLRWIESHNTDDCPCCYDTHDMSTQSPSDLLMRVLGRVHVKCPTCHRTVHYEDYVSHTSSGCEDEGPSDLLVSDILSQPLMRPTSETEQRLASNLVRRMLRSGDRGSVQIPTGGQVR